MDEIGVSGNLLRRFDPACDRDAARFAFLGHDPRRKAMEAKRGVKRSTECRRGRNARLEDRSKPGNEGRSDIDTALHELDDAESDLRRALREMPDD